MNQRVASVTGLIASVLWMVASYGQPTSRPEDPFEGATEREVAFLPLGPVHKRHVFIRNGQQIGDRTYYANGKVAQERCLDVEVPHGLQRQFYESGKLFAELPYENGRLNGTVRYYKETGELLGESKLTDGTGVLRQYRMKSLVLSDMEIPYKNGVKDGIVRQWGHFRDKETLSCEVNTYKDGQMEGWSVVYNPDGSQLESAYMHQNKLYGIHRRYVAGGQNEAGYPKYFIASEPVTEKQYREAAAKDPILAKSLDDDGHHLRDEAMRPPR